MRLVLRILKARCTNAPLIANSQITARASHFKANFCKDALYSDADIFGEENVTFGNMTTTQIMRSIGVLWICSIPGFSDNATQVRRKVMRILDIG